MTTIATDKRVIRGRMINQALNAFDDMKDGEVVFLTCFFISEDTPEEEAFRLLYDINRAVQNLARPHGGRV